MDERINEELFIIKMEILLSIEKTFQIEITDSEIETLITLADLINIIHTKTQINYGKI